jgi:hypothetical protein
MASVLRVEYAVLLIAAEEDARFCFYVHHTDAEREWAYDRKSHIGKLDKGLVEADTKGWTVVDMKKDWVRVFGFDELRKVKAHDSGH